MNNANQNDQNISDIPLVNVVLPTRFPSLLRNTIITNPRAFPETPAHNPIIIDLGENVNTSIFVENDSKQKEDIRNSYRRMNTEELPLYSLPFTSHRSVEVREEHNKDDCAYIPTTDTEGNHDLVYYGKFDFQRQDTQANPQTIVRPEQVPVIIPLDIENNRRAPRGGRKVMMLTAKNIAEKYISLSSSSKTYFLIVLVFSLAIYGIAVGFIIANIFVPRLRTVRRFSFFCCNKNNFSNNVDELCFLSIGQTSFGLIAIGQFAYGIVAIGQIAFGVTAIGQVAVGLSFILAAQICCAPLVMYCQFAFGSLYNRYSMLATAPLRLIIEENSTSPVVCCCE